jgi:putative NIF3 family GTP cyclohydrolase 1 type 2
MKLGILYHEIVETGKRNDPRPEKEIQRILSLAEKERQEMKDKEKARFDADRLWNPYSDTRVLNGDLDVEVRKLLVGIDIEAGEILLADRLREKGQTIDLILAHHPEGAALAGLHGVMGMQEDILAEMGVPINVAEAVMRPRIREVARNLMPGNHRRAVDAARLLGFPFACAHTPADNMVNTFLTNLLNAENPQTLDEVTEVLLELPEYAQSAKENAGPKIFVGEGKNRPGKIMVDMTGGTGGPEAAYENLARAGVGCVVGMHISEKNREAAEKNHVNVVIAGHISSDSLGMNLLLDQLEKHGLEVVTCSGMTRISRGAA